MFCCKEKLELRDGDIFDIKQTINGCRTFVYLDGDYRYYYDDEPQKIYEYDVKDLIYFPYFGQRHQVIGNIADKGMKYKEVLFLEDVDGRSTKGKIGFVGGYAGNDEYWVELQDSNGDILDVVVAHRDSIKITNNK